jgi:hypothetical protein
MALENSERIAFMNRQKAIMDSCFQGQRPDHLAGEEHMLAGLILGDQEKSSGLQTYIRNMMAVIDFDARRRGRLISRLELSWYSRFLASSVTEALLYFIGHDQHAPQNGARYLAQVENIRCRIAGYAYIARFEVVLEVIERMEYRLAPEYPQGKGLGAGMRMSGSVLSLAFFPPIRK